MFCEFSSKFEQGSGVASSETLTTLTSLLVVFDGLVFIVDGQGKQKNNVSSCQNTCRIVYLER